MIVNQELERRFFAGQSALGRRITYGLPDQESVWMTIVGVVGNTRRNGLDREIRPETYLPHSMVGARTLSVVLRTAGEPLELAAGVRERIWTLDPDLPIFQITTLRQALAEQVAARRFYALLLGLFSGVALVLAVSGIYGVLSYTVTQSLPDLGVRMALGASRADVFRHVLAAGLRVAALGLLAGIGLALILTRLLEGLLYEVEPTDPATYVLLSTALLAAATLACLAPALRATRVDPVVALRHE